MAGATVHFVSEDMDAGPIVAQGAVPGAAWRRRGRVSARILAMEHRLFPLALRLVATGAARLEGGRVILRRGRTSALYRLAAKAFDLKPQLAQG